MEINIPQFRNSFYMVIFLRVVKPAWADGNIYFGGYIGTAVNFAMVQLRDMLRLIPNRRGFDGRPAGIAGTARFIAGPTAVGKTVRIFCPKNNAIGLQL